MRLRPECRVISTIVRSFDASPDDPCLVRGDRPVVQLDALLQGAQDGGGRHPADRRDVGLRDAERRVREHVREVAVVGEQQQPARVGVEPADVEQALLVVAR